MKLNLIILGAASLWSLYWTLRNKHVVSGLITLGLIVGIAMAFLKLFQSSVPGISVFLIASVAALLYALFYPKFRFNKRIVLFFIILPTILYWTFIVFHLPGAQWLWYGLFVPYIAFIYGLLSPVNYKNEWGFVLLFLAEALVHIYPEFF